MSHEGFHRLRTSSSSDPYAYRETKPSKSAFKGWSPSDHEPRTPRASRRLAIPSPDSAFEKMKAPATPARPSSDSAFIQRSAPIAIPATKGDRGEGQPTLPKLPPLHVSTPLISARQPPRPTIPFMDRVIIDPGRHVPPPYASKPIIRREDQYVSIRAHPDYPNPNDPPPSDKFFYNKNISKLDYNNFTEFLSRKDATLVTFYTPGDIKTTVLASVISEAACGTKRANHAYAGVNCQQNKKLCKDNDITKLPAVRIYYRDNCLGEVKDTLFFTPGRARQLVEQAPNFDSNTLVKV